MGAATPAVANESAKVADFIFASSIQHDNQRDTFQTNDREIMVFIYYPTDRTRESSALRRFTIQDRPNDVFASTRAILGRLDDMQRTSDGIPHCWRLR